jgi:hypothetical protein
MAAAEPKKFDGDVFGVISLVDSRHDFKGTSQDTGVKIGTDVDCFQNFTNNIQREVLGLAPGYSQRLTSTCKGTEVMRRDPEDEFLKFIELNCGIPYTPDTFPADMSKEGKEMPDDASRGWNGGVAGRTLGNNFKKILVKASLFGLSVIDAPAAAVGAPPRDYKKYHEAIAKKLGYVDGGNPIPVVVDTSRTLTHDSDPYFIICRNKECVADPSNTSSMFFPLLAQETDDNIDRKYTINNVEHTVSGTLDAPVIKYKIGAADAAEYNFGAAAGPRKPNEIEVCKGKIKEVVNSVINPAVGAAPALSSYQDIVGVAGDRVKALVLFFSKACEIYNKLSYKGVVDDNVKKDIAIPYIAKRGGDQLQVESCLKSIKYKQMEFYQVPGPRGGVGEKGYKPRGVAYPDKTITNAVFWTIDRVAACYAILRGVTTVLQLPTKDIVIYKKSGFTSTWAGGKSKMRGGAACTRHMLNAMRKIHKRITNDCFLLMYKELCNPKVKYYEPFTLLNLLYYATTIREISDSTLKNIYTKNIQLNLDKCIIEAEGAIDANVGDRQILKVPDIVGIAYQPDGKIKIDGIAGTISSDELVNTLNTKSVFGLNNFMGGGKTFHAIWEDLHSSFNLEIARKLFVDFIELLATAENQYFLHRDLADNFYIYNPDSQVTHGGHSQIEMVSFLDSLISSYKNAYKSNNINKLADFLQTFIYFPYLLQHHDQNIILTQIYEYLRVWFNYEHIINKPSSNIITTIESTFNDILQAAAEKSKSVEENMTTDNISCGNYLHTVFPHGYFVIMYKSLSTKSNNRLLHNTKTSSLSNINLLSLQLHSLKLQNNTNKKKTKKRKRYVSPHFSQLSTSSAGGKRKTTKKRK